MRKSFIALALLVGGATMLTTLALAQDEVGMGMANPPTTEMNPKVSRAMLAKAARLGTSAATDTMYVGHVAPPGVRSLPWNVGVGPYRPGVGGKYDGCWDYDTYDNAATPAESDSAQGWFGIAQQPPTEANVITDDTRPWRAMDWGNRINKWAVQGRDIGIIGVWHADDGNYAPLPNSWSPLAGSKSAWCGLRADGDISVRDDASRGGTDLPINGQVAWGTTGTTSKPVAGGGSCTTTNFPGYMSNWDQILYRDVRVESGSGLTVSFLYETQMDSRAVTPGPPSNSPAGCIGWFDKDPLSMGNAYGKPNFISASLAGVNSPVDSFMVYVGCPTNPTATAYTDLNTRPIPDLKRRWFSEVIAIDKTYTEVLSTYGRDSSARSVAFSKTVPSTVIDQMITDQGGAENGGGIIRVAFRVKTNANYADEANTGGSFNSTNKGAVRIDEVSITGGDAPVSNGFEAASEIDNTIELENAHGIGHGPDVGEGYALTAWHSTGRPPKINPHLHPLARTNIARTGPDNWYNALNWADACGPAESPSRVDGNWKGVVVSMTDHTLSEAAAGGPSTAFNEMMEDWVGPTINLVTNSTPPGLTPNECGLDYTHVTTTAKWRIWFDVYDGLLADRNARGNLMSISGITYPTLQKNGAVVWGGIVPSGWWSWGVPAAGFTYTRDFTTYATSNANGIPDSLRLVFRRANRCTYLAATNCANTDGLYFDNISLAFPPPLAGAKDGIEHSIWNVYNDAFPWNQTETWPGTAAFDTCAAYTSVGSQLASSMVSNRPVVAADSCIIHGLASTTNPMRMDMVFRVFPGPGNYVSVGHPEANLGLRQVPTSATAASSGDGSFWGEYMASPGEFSKGTHSGDPNGWDVNTWNSVRCDTAEYNIFPVIGHSANLPGLTNDYWSTTIYDGFADPPANSVRSEPKYNTLGITKNRCFLNNPAPGQAVNETNIVCSPPAWVTTLAPGDGYDGNATTKEYTNVFPSGLFTPGTSVQYFLRFSQLATPAVFAMEPDTDRVYPQPNGQFGYQYDGMRWEHFSVLPDRWKEYTYGGPGMACMLVVDSGDRREDERFWVGIADSIGPRPPGSTARRPAGTARPAMWRRPTVRTTTRTRRTAARIPASACGTTVASRAARGTSTTSTAAATSLTRAAVRSAVVRPRRPLASSWARTRRPRARPRCWRPSTT